jgi:hypothetical protein
MLSGSYIVALSFLTVEEGKEIEVIFAERGRAI